MDYQAVYDRFILDRQSKADPVGYSEKHHIIPRSMGGSNGKDNLVRLTPSDHLFAHKLLARIHNTRGMWFALVTMCSKGGLSARGISANRKDYDKARTGFAAALKENHHLRGKKLSESHKMKVSQNSPRLSGPNHPMFGKKQSQKSREAMSKNSRRIGGKDHPMYGKKHTPETIEILKKANGGVNNGRADKNIYNVIHVDGRKFTGTRFDFYSNLDVGVSKSNAHLLFNGKIQSLKGWRILND